jgi:hypothetical protein
MVAVSSIDFSVYEQYTSATNADGTTSQSGALQAGVTVGTDDGSEYGSAILLDVKQAPASKKLSDGLKAVNTLTQLALNARTQAPKDAAAGRLARAIQSLRAINLVGGGIRSVQEAVRIAQEIAGAVRDLAAAEQAIAADGGTVSAGASAGAAAAAISSALSGASTAPSSASTGAAASTHAAATSSAHQDADGTPEAVEAGYSTKVGNDVTGLVAGQAGFGSGPAANHQVASTLSQIIIAQLQAAGLPVNDANLTKSLQDLITDPLLGAQELQASAKQAGLNVTVSTSLDVENTLADPRSAAAAATSPGAIVAAINDPYDSLIHDAVAALAAIGKGLKKALPPLLNSPDKHIARLARKAQQDFQQAVADTVQSIGKYYTAKSEILAEGGSDGTPSPATKAAIDAADATIDGPSDANDQGGTAGDDAALGDAGLSASGSPAIAAGAVASTSIGIHVSVNISA